MATRPAFRPRSRSRSATVASTPATRDSPLTIIVTVVSILTRSGHFRSCEQLKPQMPFGVAVHRFDDQRRLRPGYARHIKFQPRAAVDSGFGFEFFRIGGAFHSSYNARVIHGFATLAGKRATLVVSVQNRESGEPVNHAVLH